MQKSLCILTVHVCSQFILHRIRNELAHSLTNGNHFSSLLYNNSMVNRAIYSMLSYVTTINEKRRCRDG